MRIEVVGKRITQLSRVEIPHLTVVTVHAFLDRRMFLALAETPDTRMLLLGGYAFT